MRKIKEYDWLHCEGPPAVSSQYLLGRAPLLRVIIYNLYRFVVLYMVILFLLLKLEILHFFILRIDEYEKRLFSFFNTIFAIV